MSGCDFKRVNWNDELWFFICVFIFAMHLYIKENKIKYFILVLFWSKRQRPFFLGLIVWRKTHFLLIMSDCACLRRLESVQGMIHPVAFILRLVRWKQSWSFLFFMTWLFYYKYILCLLPVLLFLHSPPPLRESVDEINQAIHFLQQAIQPISSKQRVFLSLLFSLAWINSVMRSTLTLVWCSIWVIMCLTSQCSIALQAALWFRPERIETEQATERYYCFELHHHQRWWFGTGWGHFLLPQDPPAW